MVRAPKAITLADVYLALNEQLVASETANETLSCSLENALHKRVSDILTEIEEKLVQKLAETSITEILSFGTDFQ